MANSTHEDTTIVPKKKAISPVWDHFGQCVDGKGKVIDSDVHIMDDRSPSTLVKKVHACSSIFKIKIL